MWETAESQLREILTELEIPFMKQKEKRILWTKNRYTIKTALNMI